MLTEEDIRRIAKRTNLNVGLTEKDYVIEWLLKGIYGSEIKNNLIFKGGTAIKKVYFQETWRFSHDLDFTTFNLDKDKLRDARSFWEVGLKDLVKELPDFNLVVHELKNKLGKL